MSIHLALAAVVASASSGLVGTFGERRRGGGQFLSTLMMVIAAGLGLGAVVSALLAREAARLSWSWFIPWGRFAVEIDALSAFFLAPVFLIPTLGSIYGLSYWSQRRHPRSGARVRICYGLVTASMAMVVLARDAVLFLVVWEIMALAAFFLVTAEDDDAEACAAGWVYLIAAHVGTFCLMTMFVLLHRATGSFDIAPAALDSQAATGIFLLGAIGFGLKAGIMPLHVWLPGAHANAPSHVSAVLSGVMLKMGVYGIVRLVTLLPPPRPWWGGLLLAFGAISGIAGIAFAIGQRDLKRALAYSSIENVGVIAIGLGLALLGRAAGRVDVVLLGLGGALLHVWNHALFKSLLFFNAGAVIHAARTREINRLGGLVKRMPQVAATFLVGAVAICALPPLNGFVSELLIYLGAARMSGLGTTAGVNVWPAASVVIPVLAMIGALAVACFVGLFGGVFLGQARPACDHAHDPAVPMRLPMTLLAMGCLVIGLAPALLLPIVNRVASVWVIGSAETSLAGLVPAAWVTIAGVACLVLVALGAFVCKRLVARRALATAGTWDCGYARPTSRMQYSNASFGHTLVDLFSWLLHPRHDRPRLDARFPGKSAYATQVPDIVLDRSIVPTFRMMGRFLPWVRLLQQGQIQTYVFYILLIIVALFLGGSCAR